jgi:stage V sporulation protein S
MQQPLLWSLDGIYGAYPFWFQLTSGSNEANYDTKQTFLLPPPQIPTLSGIDGIESFFQLTSASNEANYDSKEISVPLSSSHIPKCCDADKVLTVNSTSLVQSVAGSIAHLSRAGKFPIILATGAAAINQTVKAMATARRYMVENGIDILVKVEVRSEKKML